LALKAYQPEKKTHNTGRQVLKMNVYFWLFGIAGVLSIPMTLQVTLRAGRKIHYHVRFRAAGLPLAQKEEQGDEAEERVFSRQTARGLFALDGKMVWPLIRQGHVMRAVRVMRLEKLFIRIRLSFADAAITAMSFAAVRAFAQTLLLCTQRALPLEGRVETGDVNEGTEVLVRGIFSARLGSLLAAALRLALAAVRVRAGISHGKTEEEQYAAASH